MNKLRQVAVVAVALLTLIYFIAEVNAVKQEVRISDNEFKVFDDKGIVNLNIKIENKGSRLGLLISNLFQTFDITFDKYSWTKGDIVEGRTSMSIENACSNARVYYELTKNGGGYSESNYASIGSLAAFSSASWSFDISSSSLATGVYTFKTTFKCRNSVGTYVTISPIFNDNNPDTANFEIVPGQTTCQPNWQCNSWGSCSSSGQQTRSCTDLNQCNQQCISSSCLTSRSCTYTPSPVCGNGAVEGTEQCDTGSLNGACPKYCSGACVINDCNAQDDGGDTGDQTGDSDGANIIVVANSMELPKPESFFVSNPSVTYKFPFKVKLKNIGSTTGKIKVEAGFYTRDYAQNVAQLYSIFPSFATVDPIANCVPAEQFVKTVEVTLAPNEEKEVKIEQIPLSAYMTLPVGQYNLEAVKLVSFIGVYQNCCQKLPGFEGCAEGTGGYVASEYDPNFYLKDLSDFKQEEIYCKEQVYGNVDYKLFSKDTITINKDYKTCIDYQFYTKEGQLNETATDEFKQKTLIQLKKYPLTKDQIKTATTSDLLASACLSSSECLGIQNYSSSCVKLSALRGEGLITQETQQQIFTNGKGLATLGAVGGSAGLTICLASAITGPGALVGCGVGGALGLIGLEAGRELASSELQELFSKDDALTKAIKDGDSNVVGICVAEEDTFAGSEFIKKIGRSLPITGNENTDGLIIIGAGVLLILFAMGSFGGKK